MKIMVCGDTHGFWGVFNTLINRRKPDIILVCGDFGWWPKLFEYKLKNKETKIYFCDGNHEDHWDLKEKVQEFGKVPIELEKNVFYMPRGTVLTLSDKRNVLFMGGADSIDKNARHIGRDWFPEEVITQRDFYELPEIRINIVISHTVPYYIVPELLTRGIIGYGKERDPSCVALNGVLDKYRPALWYCGHLHRRHTTTWGDTKITILNESRCSGHWLWLPD